MYEFSIGWLIVGILIIAFGACVSLFYKQISDNLASGVSSYQNVKKFGLITVIVGFVVALSLHTLILNWIVSMIFPGRA